ncbi:hypothetical protein KDE12_01320 [Campylobacter sp. faydin G-105]|uniref:hypothetical protein n=1 Tax=Campylobacter anatolicus TaxID=2829105 RepID=UPI001B98A5FB|nr:hypothetical protein [Campylobacter anatolicus]MBR8461492.1 hypothetical protein [Campylobacter anatolicus]
MSGASAKDYAEWIKIKRKNSEVKHTSDDVFTPPCVYENVLKFVKSEWGELIKGKRIMRPFYPGGNYLKEDYTNAVVIDNPPFSLNAAILDYYVLNNIPFFLFAPSLTAGTTLSVRKHLTLVCDKNGTVTYKNDVKVCTAFFTNLDRLANQEPRIMLGRDVIQQEEQQALKRPPNEYINIAKLASCTKVLDIPLKECSFYDKSLDGKRVFGRGINLPADILNLINANRAERGLRLLKNDKEPDRQRALL